MQGLAFLGIPASKFDQMKAEYEGIDGLYEGVQDMIIAFEVNEVFYGRGENLMTETTISPLPIVKIAPAYKDATHLSRKTKKQTKKQKVSIKKIQNNMNTEIKSIIDRAKVGKEPPSRKRTKYSNGSMIRSSVWTWDN